MKASVVIANYNNSKFIDECIESLKNQTYKNIEYIIVDGGSTDGSEKIIEKYKSKVSKVIIEKEAELVLKKS